MIPIKNLGKPKTDHNPLDLKLKPTSLIRLVGISACMTNPFKNDIIDLINSF
ncbi:hypothetical protein BTM381_20170 [Helicobacter pylori]